MEFLYSDLEDQIGPELTWFCIYHALAQTIDALHMTLEECDKSELQHSRFLFTLENRMRRLLIKHGFTLPQNVSDTFCDDALEYLLLNTPQQNTVLLSSYLNYLEDFALQSKDWKTIRPLAFSQIDYSNINHSK